MPTILFLFAAISISFPCIHTRALELVCSSRLCGGVLYCFSSNSAIRRRDKNRNDFYSKLQKHFSSYSLPCLLSPPLSLSICAVTHSRCVWQKSNWNCLRRKFQFANEWTLILCYDFHDWIRTAHRLYSVLCHFNDVTWFRVNGWNWKINLMLQTRCESDNDKNFSRSLSRTQYTQQSLQTWDLILSAVSSSTSCFSICRHHVVDGMY